MHGDRNGDDVSPKLTDTARLLLFEWHAAHLESWVQEFPPPRSVNLTYGLAARDFHTTSIVLALLRKFFSGKDEVSLGKVVGALKNVATGLEHEHRVALKRLQADYRREGGPLDQQIRYRTGDGPERSSMDIMWDVAYGLLIHSDPDRGARLREAGKQTHGAITLPAAQGAVLELLTIIRKVREDGTVPLPAPYEQVWLPARREDVSWSLDEVDTWNRNPSC